MSRLAVIGEEARVRGFALAGALVFAAEDAAGARAAWRSLPSDVAVAVLTPRAARWLADVASEPAGPAGGLPRPGRVLPVVMPSAAGETSP
jgi:vacuolar-type H+-ATPase subunit F/Vma7